jgi:hypothetical protein
MRPMPPPAWRSWLLLGVAIGLLGLIACKAAERYRPFMHIGALLGFVAFEGPQRSL